MANIKYELNGGTLCASAQRISHLGNVYYLLPTAEKAGKAFLGWQDESGQRVVAVKDGATVEAIFVEASGVRADGKQVFYLGRCPQQEIHIADHDLALALKSSEQAALSKGLVKYFQKKFFTFDPIRWVILGAAGDGAKLAVAEKVLDTRQYDGYRSLEERCKAQSDDFSKIVDSRAKVDFVVKTLQAGPDIRQALLDEDFFIFRPDEKKRIVLSESRGNDPLFLLEVHDFQNPAYFAEATLTGPAPSRIAFPTDYAKARQLGYDVRGVDGSEWYWTSSEMADWRYLFTKAFNLSASEKEKVIERLPGNMSHWCYSKAMLVGEDPSKERDLIYYIDYSYDPAKHDLYVNTGSISYTFKDYHFGGVRPALLVK